MPISTTISLTGDCNNSNSGVIEISATTYNTNNNFNGLISEYTDDTSESQIYSIEWISPNLGIDYNTNKSRRTNLSSGSYYILIRRFNNDVTNQEIATITPYITKNFCTDVYETNNTSCGGNDGEIKFSASSTNGEPYQLILRDTNQSIVTTTKSNLSDYSFSSLSAGTYDVTIVDNCGCSAKTETVVIENTEPFDFGLYVIPNSNCNTVPTGKIMVTGETIGFPYTYLWGDGQTGNTITGLTNGGYQVTVTNSLGCSVTKTATIESVPPIGIFNTSTQQPTCFANDGQINIYLSGGTPPYYYSSSTGDITVTYSDYISFTGLTSGLYNFIIKDAGYCQIQYSALLQTPNSIYNFNISSQNSNCSLNDGSITVTLLGGIPPYLYTIINPDGSTKTETTNQISYLFSNLSAGTYTIAVQDQSACGKTQEVYIITEDKYTIETSVTGSTQRNDGIIKTIITEGGTLPLTCSLDNKQKITLVDFGEVYFYNIQPGQHEVIVTDFTGCQQKSQIFVPTISTIDFYLKSTQPTNIDDGIINVFITDGTPPFVFNWSDNVPNNPQEIIITGLTAGTYSVTITDSNKTVKSRTIEVTSVKRINSYNTFGMATKQISVNTESNYNLLRMLNEGYQEIISGHTSCNLVSAKFTAKTTVKPFNTTNSNIFYVSTSLTDAPTENLWYETAEQLLMAIQGVKKVNVDLLTNSFTIEADLTNPSIIYGSNSIGISLSLSIEYEINCEQ